MTVFNCPAVLVIAFNRPEMLRMVITSIREVRPSKLFLAVDAPHDMPDIANVSACRSVIKTIDWPCEISTLFHETHMGCRSGVTSAIDWFFSCVDEGIILEDDCVPHRSFFGYAAELLDRYRYDERVAHISGNCFLCLDSSSPMLTGGDSYYFSRYTHVWGWAGWRRAWRLFDVNMREWPKIGATGLAQFIPDSPHPGAWAERMQNTYSGLINTWDWQWQFACMINRKLTINPVVNLVSNIGFGAHATHTINHDDAKAAIPMHEMHLPLRHPTRVVRNADIDTWMDRFVYKTNG